MDLLYSVVVGAIADPTTQIADWIQPSQAAIYQNNSLTPFLHFTHSELLGLINL
jgi:hypothetical protein